MKTRIWQSEEQQLERLAHSYPTTSMFQQFIRKNLGKPATITLCNEEKLDVVLVEASKNMPILAVQRNVTYPNFLLIRTPEIVSVGLQHEPRRH